MKRLIARRLRKLADRIDPQPKPIITLNCGAEPDLTALLDGIRNTGLGRGGNGAYAGRIVD